MDNSEGNREDGRWLSYTELARIRGISKESAIRLVRRERWRKLPGNDAGGTVRVLVPEDWLRPAREDNPPVDPLTNPTPIREGIPEDLRSLTAGWEQAVILSRIRAEAAEARAEKADVDRRAAETRADRADADRRSAEGRAERAEAALGAERQRAETLRASVDELKAKQTSMTNMHAKELAAAQQAADDLRQADETRKARGRLRRAWDGWRGR